MWFSVQFWEHRMSKIQATNYNKLLLYIKMDISDLDETIMDDGVRSILMVQENILD